MASNRTWPTLPLRYPFPLGRNGTPPPLMLWAQQHKPACPVVLPSGAPAWMLTRRSDVAQVLADPRFTRNNSAAGAPRIVGEDVTSVADALFNLDPPDHTRVRQVVSGFYTRQAVERYRPVIVRQAHRLLDRMRSGTGPTDLVESYTARLSLDVTSRILGVPQELAEDYRAVFPMSADMTAGARRTEQETRAAVRFVTDLVAAHRATAAYPDSPVQGLIRACDDGVISSSEMLGTVFLLMLTSSDAIVPPSTTGPMILMMHPQQLKACLEEPALWPKAVEEVLRYFHNGGIGFPRVATEDVHLHDTLIRRGDAVVVSLQSATWDPRHYRDPREFDIHRTTDGSATFGAGPHYCLGSRLARLYLHEALRALFTTFPTLHLAVDEEHIRWDHNRMFARPLALPVSW